jgi:hypothetical protein
MSLHPTARALLEDIRKLVLAPDWTPTDAVLLGDVDREADERDPPFDEWVEAGCPIDDLAQAEDPDPLGDIAGTFAAHKERLDFHDDLYNRLHDRVAALEAKESP